MNKTHGKPMTRKRKALLSVSDKDGVVEFARRLRALDFELLSTGGTAALLTGNGIAVTEVSDYTGFPEMMDGRLKTLHPMVHGGLLGRRGRDDEVMAEYGIDPIDMVVVNLYPFEATINQPDCSLAQAIENIDIGGPTMLRAAAKNYTSVTVVVDPADYDQVADALEKNGVDATTRQNLARKVFAHTARYDSAISAYLDGQWGQQEDSAFPEQLSFQVDKVQEMRRLRGNNARRKNGSKSVRVFPLTGILRCDQCGGRMRGLANNKGVRYYACVNRLQKKAPCTQPMVRADDIEAQVAELLRSLPGDETWREDVLAHAFPDDLLAAENQAATLQARYDRLVEMYIIGKIDRAQFDRQEADYRRELALLTAGQKRDMLEAVQLVIDFPDLWDNADPLQKKKLLQQIFTTVHVKGKKIEGVQPVKSFYALFEYCCYGSDGRVSFLG